MNIEVSSAAEDEKPIVRRLLELNSHDFSEFDGRDLGPHGEYGYRYLDHYWIDGEDRRPFIVRVDGAIAGCVLVRAGSHTGSVSSSSFASTVGAVWGQRLPEPSSNGSPASGS